MTTARKFDQLAKKMFRKFAFQHKFTKQQASLF